MLYIFFPQGLLTEKNQFHSISFNYIILYQVNALLFFFNCVCVR